MNLPENFYESSMDDMKRGYIEEEGCFTCLLCGRKIEKGIIYPVGELLYEPEKYMKKHIEDEHGSVFEYLNKLDKKLTGLSEHQMKLIRLFYNGKNDGEVQKELNIGSTSTVRNHRFALRERERQSKIFLVMMELLNEKDGKILSVMSPHKGAVMVDDRYNITEEENEKLLKKYFPESLGGKLKTFSMQEKHRIVVLREIIKHFEPGRIYNEKEINNILKDIYEYDYVTIRRYLIEYGFMDRVNDGSRYWVKENSDTPKSGLKAEKVISGVYQIRNTKNGKVYITSGRNISKLNGDRFELNLGSFRIKPLQEEWKQYGENAFVFEILESFEENGDREAITRRLKELERKWIEKLQPFGEKGYNQA